MTPKTKKNDGAKVTLDVAEMKSVLMEQKDFLAPVVQEAMQARYKKAAENAEKVEKSEAALNKRLVAKLATAGTATERETINASIAASSQRVAMAQEKTKQCKRECDLLAGKLQLAKENKVEVDKEWAKKMLAEMRKRAVDAMSAQENSDATDNASDAPSPNRASAPTA